MQYKTIVLGLLQQNQELHERLRRERTGKRRADAEEPVTARIRRRAEPRNECGVPAATRITHQEPLAKTHRWTMRVREQDTLAEAEGHSL